MQNDKFLKTFQITTVINKSNINQLEDLYKVMEDLEVDSWRIVNMDPIGRAMDNDNLSLDKNDYINLLDFIENKRKNLNLMLHMVVHTFRNEKRKYC